MASPYPIRPMAAAGLVAELRPGTLASLPAALSWDRPPGAR